MRKLKMNLNLNPISTSDIRESKSNLLLHLMKTYTPPEFFEHIDDLKRSFVFGKNQFIAALTTNNLSSGAFTRAVMREADPQYLILGNFNNYHLSLMTSSKPSLILNPSDLFCKDALSSYLSQSQNDLSHLGIFDLNQRVFFEVDHRYRQIWTNDYLTGGLNALDFDQTKVLYGSPSSIISVEDLMLRFQLRQLEDIYSQVLNEIKTEGKNETLYNPRVISTLITETAAQKFKNILHHKSILYTASVFRSCAMMGKSNLLLCNKHFSTQIRHFVQKSKLNTEDVYRAYLQDQEHEDRELYVKTLKQISKQQILRKFYLACQLVDPAPLKMMEMGHNVLRESIFGRKLGRTSGQLLFEQTLQKSKKYHQMFLDLQTYFIENNLTISFPQQPKKLQLSEQLELEEQRKIDFPVEYEIDSLKADAQQKLQLMKIQNMMESYLQSERRHKDHKLLLEFRKKNYTKQNIILFTKLLGQLKIRTGSKVKLPLHHFKQFSGYFKQVMRDMMLEKEYGVKRIAPPQEKERQIEQKYDISYQEIQQIMENRDLKSDGETKQMMINMENRKGDWDLDQDTRR